jgi:hypothetical protein
MPDERSRLEVDQALSEKLGPEVAAALMECVPPFSWMEIATKNDLAQLEKRLEATTNLRFDALEAKMDGRFEGVEGRGGRPVRWGGGAGADITSPGGFTGGGGGGGSGLTPDASGLSVGVDASNGGDGLVTLTFAVDPGCASPASGTPAQAPAVTATPEVTG